VREYIYIIRLTGLAHITHPNKRQTIIKVLMVIALKKRRLISLQLAIIY